MSEALEEQRLRMAKRPTWIQRQVLNLNENLVILEARLVRHGCLLHLESLVLDVSFGPFGKHDSRVRGHGDLIYWKSLFKNQRK